MKDIMFWVLLLVLSVSNSLAAECPAPVALEYEYGPYTAGTKIRTEGGLITQWVHGVTPQPDQGQIDQAITDCTLGTARTDKIKAIKDHALSLVPEFTDYGTFRAFAEFYQSVDNKTPTAWVSNVILVRAKAIAAIALVNGYSTLADIEAYDETVDPDWP